MWLVLTKVGFAAFLLGLVLLIWQGFTAEGRARPCLRWYLSACLAGLLLWIVALGYVPRADQWQTEVSTPYGTTPAHLQPVTLPQNTPSSSP